MPIKVLPREGVLAPDMGDESEAALRARLDGLAPADSTIAVERYLLSGDEAVEIIDAATETGCDLIVMGTHGRSGVSRLLMGSVAEEVSRKAPCGVVTVKAKAAE
jgi:nucleotide-binding universal stress UspA family protein